MDWFAPFPLWKVRVDLCQKRQAPKVNEYKEFVSCPRSVRPAQNPAREPWIALFRWSRHSLSPQYHGSAILIWSF